MKRKRINIDELNADQLRGFISVARHRLIEITADNAKLAESIPGQEAAKRAIQVAAAGNHDMVICGPSGTDVDRLVILAAQFGVAAYAVECCPCGCYTDPKRICNCTPAAIHRHWNKIKARPEIQGAAIYVEAMPVPFHQIGKPGLSFYDMKKYIEGTGPRPGLELDDPCVCLLRQANKVLGCPVATIRSIIDVAATIAALDHRNSIQACHLAESIQYRRFDRDILH